MWYHLSALGHFCDTSDGTGELRKRPDNQLRKSGSGNMIAVYVNELPFHIAFIMKFDECKTYLLAACGPRSLLASVGSKTNTETLIRSAFDASIFSAIFDESLLELCSFAAIFFSTF